MENRANMGRWKSLVPDPLPAKGGSGLYEARGDTLALLEAPSEANDIADIPMRHDRESFLR